MRVPKPKRTGCGFVSMGQVSKWCFCFSFAGVSFIKKGVLHAPCMFVWLMHLDPHAHTVHKRSPISNTGKQPMFCSFPQKLIKRNGKLEISRVPSIWCFSIFGVSLQVVSFWFAFLQTGGSLFRPPPLYRSEIAARRAPEPRGSDRHGEELRAGEAVSDLVSRRRSQRSWGWVWKETHALLRKDRNVWGYFYRFRLCLSIQHTLVWIV